MERKEGFYWCKIKGQHPMGWFVYWWHDQKLEIFKDGFWTLGNDMFSDSDFIEINETRIPSPDEALFGVFKGKPKEIYEGKTFTVEKLDNSEYFFLTEVKQ